MGFFADQWPAQYFGAQRFGREGDNAVRGKQILLGKNRQRGWLRRLLLSAYQSQLFNDWLAARIAAQTWPGLLEGDVVRKTESGGQFVVSDLTGEAARLAAGEIELTGPIYGAKMKAAEGEAARLEQEILEQAGVNLGTLKKNGLEGTRRAASLLPADMQIEAIAEGALRFTFFLPKGAYATVVLREFMEGAHA